MKYPLYVISKGRWESGLTAKFLIRDGVDFSLVVEPQEHGEYAARFGADRVLTLPFSNLGLGSIPARNWCWEHAKASGAARHWILDDNIRGVYRLYKGKRIPCESGPAFTAVEDFVDRYTNIGVAGLNYTMFGMPVAARRGIPPFYRNVRVYSCLLIDNHITQRWRGRYNEDTDLCLQVLGAGLCTVLVNVFMVNKAATMTMRGGNTDELYAGDGRLTMSRSLERAWPGVVETHRKYGRSHHRVVGNWRKFDTPLVLREDVDLEALAQQQADYGLRLTATGDVTSEAMRRLLAEQQ